MREKRTLLVVDRDAGFRRSVVRAVDDSRVHVLTAEDAREASGMMNAYPVDAAIVEDVALADPTFPEALADLPWVLSLLPQSSPSQEVTAGWLLEKPSTPERIAWVCTRALARRSPRSKGEDTDDFVASSAVGKRIRATADRAADTRLSVLLIGESGVGKTALAKRIARRSDPDRPLVTLDPALAARDLSEALAEARDEERTILVSSTDALAPDTQALLLRALETSTPGTRFRVIAEALPRLRDEVLAGRFSRDLFHRLGSITIDVPPLRSRKEDIVVLAYHFLRQRTSGVSPPKFTAAALRSLRLSPLPNNVQELEAAVEHAALVHRGGVVSVADLALTDTAGPRLELGELPYAKARKAALTAFELAYAEDVIRRADGNISLAARLAEVDRSNFRRLLRRRKTKK